MNAHILWADDEIDLLKPHIRFLEAKGYTVTGVPSGADALDACQEGNQYDIVFLDENMPGMSGLEALIQIKAVRPTLPIVMITKSEEEHIMEGAIGAKIADYLIKPLNPNQILLSVKKILDSRRLTDERTKMGYQQDFRNLAMAYQDRIGHEEWADIYKKLTYWELEIDATQGREMGQIFAMQKEEANANFAKFITEEYEDWLNAQKPKAGEVPMMSHQLMRERVFPMLSAAEPTWFILIDNLRLDQWKVLQPAIEQQFRVEEESHFYSILPTATQYARNAIFSGMMPSEMAQKLPNLWVSDEADEGKNNQEEEFLRLHMGRIPRLKDMKMSYHKILSTEAGKNLAEKLHTLSGNALNVIVYNFVDMLSHARTDTQMIRELAPDEAAYRSITQSWFAHSPLAEIMSRIAAKGGKVVLTTDHGTIRVKRPFKIVGERSVNSNLRYKQGRNLGFDDDGTLLHVKRPERFFLPKPNVSTSYVFTKEDYFLAYPNNYNHYVNLYRDTFQHGGISLEEMIIPYVVLKAR
jgi:CheY-like chemotaxis protein